MSNPVKVVIHRRRKMSEGEQVAEFVFSDLAQVAARAICEKYRWPVSVINVQENGDFSTRYEWGQRETGSVVEAAPLSRIKLVKPYGVSE